MPERPIEVLVVEDNEADVYLTTTALRDARISSNIHVVADGEQAIAFLNHERTYADAPRPDLVLLDLNLPKKTGFEVLEEMSADAQLRNIPVIVGKRERPSHRHSPRLRPPDCWLSSETPKCG